MGSFHRNSLNEPRNESRNNLLSSSSCPELSVRKSCIVIVFKAGPVFQFCLTVFFSLTWFSFEKKLRFEPQKARNILDRLVSFHETTGDQTKSFANSLFIGTVYIRTLYKAKETLERKLEDWLSNFQVLLRPCKRKYLQ